MVKRGALSEYVDNLQAQGRLTFTREEAMAALEVSMEALKLAALRLSKRRRLVSPRRGFYVIVPLEHREAGAPPVDGWLPALLRFHGVRVGEIVTEGDSAIVTVDRSLRPLRCGRYGVSFRRRSG